MMTCDCCEDDGRSVNGAVELTFKSMISVITTKTLEYSKVIRK